MSVLRAGRGRRGGGWGGGWGGGVGSFKFFFPQKHLPGVLRRKKKFFFPTKYLKKKNVPGVLKRMQNYYFFRRGGGILGVWGAPRPHPVVARGRKTIHFFL